MSKRRLLKLSEHALNKKKWIQWILFIMWCGFIFWMTLFNRKPLNQRVFRPDLFYEIKKWITGSRRGGYLIKLFLENILLFIPFGLLIPWKKNWRAIVIIGCGSSIIIELTQYVTMLGEFELDDIIANTIGVAIGLGLYILIKRIIRKLGVNNANCKFSD